MAKHSKKDVQLHKPGPLPETSAEFARLCDADIDPAAAVDANELDALRATVSSQIRLELKGMHVGSTDTWMQLWRAHMAVFLRLFDVSHESIRLLVGQLKNHPAMVADGVSVSREQIEKVFVVSLITSNPRRWLRQYLRNDWRASYEEYLWSRKHNGRLERFSSYLREAPKNLDRRRSMPRQGKLPAVHIVSNTAKAALKHRLDKQPGTPWPARFSAKRWPPGKDPMVRGRDYIEQYFMFPTPGKSIPYLSDDEMKLRLKDWHREYSSICQYSHVGVGKGVLCVFATWKDVQSAETTEIISTKAGEGALIISYVAFASACVEILSRVPDKFGARDRLFEFWIRLAEVSLVAKRFARLYVPVLKPSLAT